MSDGNEFQRSDTATGNVRQPTVASQNGGMSSWFDDADVLIEQSLEQCLHHLLPDTINICSMELTHRGHSLLFLSANITCIKTHLFHNVCSNVCSY